MLRLTQSLILFFVCSFSFAIQECDDDPLLFELLSLLTKDDDNESNEYRVYPRDTVRTEDSEFRIGANVLLPTTVEGMRPGGVEMAFYKAMSDKFRLYIGSSFSYYNYGFDSYDTLFGDYNHINTLHNIYSLNLHIKQRIINKYWLKAYLGLQSGLLFLHTFSKAVDLSCDCEREPDKTLQTKFNSRPNFGPTVDLQIPVNSIYDRISIHVGYQMTGLSRYVKKGDVDIRPNEIRFHESQNRLNLLNFQIGYSHFF